MNFKKISLIMLFWKLSLSLISIYLFIVVANISRIFLS